MNYKASATTRACAALLVGCCLLFAPLVALAKKGEKNYNRGVQYEKMHDWMKAAQEFALAVAANPSDSEYQLHYRRAVFNASQSFMEQGRTLAEQGDYTGAYNAFRQAYGYDPINELAASEMQRMLRLQREKEGRNNNTNGNGTNGAGVSERTTASPQADGVAAVPASYRPGGTQQAPSPRTEQQRVIKFNGDLETFIRQLARDLDLNVIFDRDFPKRPINIELNNVTTARALDFVFVAQGLFFQKLDRRTILVADQNKRPQYQQLVLRTFYLSNTDPNDARSLIQSALPPNAGRQAQVVPNKQTNSITVRDTPENIALIAKLLQNVDKDRAEVVMDVSIYEVSRNNLLQIGNQLGDQTALTTLGGLLPSTFPFGAHQDRITGATTTGSKTGGGTSTATIIPNIVTGSFILPGSAVSLFQSKDNSRLLASTQVHAFDGEQSTANIGQKVPVQTAAVSNYIGTPSTTTTNGSPATAGLFGGGYPVIQYQDTGLNMKFTPTVFPDQEVQVKMEIESNDVVGGASNLTPIFSQRHVSGTARIPNNRTMMIASISQDKQSDGRRGVPVLGLVPVFGRLFSTPTKSNDDSDIVITVTPRVLRAPTITPEDLEERDSGTLSTPATQSLEAFVNQADREDQLASARQLPTNASVQLPTPLPNFNDPEPPTFVPAPAALSTSATNNAAPGTTTNANMMTVTNTSASNTTQPAANRNTNALMPFVPAALVNAANRDVALVMPALNVNTPQPTPAGNNTTAPVVSAALTNQPTMMPAVENRTAVAPAASDPSAGAGAALLLVSNQPEMRVGEKQRLMILVKTGTPLSLAATTLRFDPHLFAVRAVTKGNLFDGAQSAATLTQSIDPAGSLLAVVAPAAGTQIKGMGVLLLVEIEALAPGESDIKFEQSGVHFMAADGHSVAPQLAQAHFVVKK
jgi:general secretion pathway protein D